MEANLEWECYIQMYMIDNLKSKFDLANYFNLGVLASKFAKLRVQARQTQLDFYWALILHLHKHRGAL